MEAVTGSLGLGGLGGGLTPELPTGSNDLPSAGGAVGASAFDAPSMTVFE